MQPPQTPPTHPLIPQDRTLSHPPNAYPPLLLLTTAHPPPPPLTKFHTIFSTHLTTDLHSANLSRHAHIYPPPSLHITVATLQQPQPPPATPLTPLATAWHSLLHPIYNPPTPTTANLHLHSATVFDDGIAVLLWHDPANVIHSWRSQLQTICQSPTTIITSPKSNPSTPTFPTPIRIPSIIHSTILRWRRAPNTSPDTIRPLIDDAFRRAMAAVGGQVVINVSQLSIVEETAPCLSRSHIHHVFPSSSHTS